MFTLSQPEIEGKYNIQLTEAHPQLPSLFLNLLSVPGQYTTFTEAGPQLHYL